MGGKKLDWKFSLIIGLIICSIVGVIFGFLALRFVNELTIEVDRDVVFWLGFVIGFCAPGYFWIKEKIYPYIATSERNKRWHRSKAGYTYEGIPEKVEEKDDYKDIDWLKYQYYDLGKTIQDIADDQGVSMITIRKWIDKLEKS